ncbi:MAG: hypothetical protein P4L40_07970 [Terracidiphilus sp.]|nr:hypothetical protein [Terracidiphilus sp.]
MRVCASVWWCGCLVCVGGVVPLHRVCVCAPAPKGLVCGCVHGSSTQRILSLLTSAVTQMGGHDVTVSIVSVSFLSLIP